MLIPRLKILGHLAIAGIILVMISSCSTEPKSRGQVTPAPQSSSSTQKQKRIALVIGNASYQVGKLDTPLNDAMDMNDALQELGFEVILLKDASKREMNDALDQFSTRINQGYVSLFYFAGHGMQVEGENYLIPVNNAQIKAEKDIEYESMPLGKILSRMQDAGNQINIVILDACRDNPFRGFWRSSSRGLSVPVQPATEMFIAFATAPEKVASDGTGRNGLFTFYLLKYIKTPNLDVDLMFRRVRSEVIKNTNNYQVPWNSSSLTGEFAFNQKSAKPSPIMSSSPIYKPSPTQGIPSSTPKPSIIPTPTPQKSSPKLPKNPLVSSETGKEYTELRKLLSQKKWKEADQETWISILAIANNYNPGRLNKESLKNLSCEDLGIINREWLRASGNKFGFSPQLTIYKQTGNPTGQYDNKAFHKFGDAVGWRIKGTWKKYIDLWYKGAPSSAPKGYLPRWGVSEDIPDIIDREFWGINIPVNLIDLAGVNFPSLSERLVDCDL